MSDPPCNDERVIGPTFAREMQNAKCRMHNPRTRKTLLMIMKRTLLAVLLSAFCILHFAFLVGCASRPLFNTTPQSIENKAYLITRIAVAKVIQQHPNARPKLQIAADDLLILEQSPTLNVEPILAIIQRLPPDTFKDPNTGLYVEAGVLFFADELGTLGAQNPEQLKAAARGMRRGLESFLGQ